jgi:hypothetical protein
VELLCSFGVLFPSRAFACYAKTDTYTHTIRSASILWDISLQSNQLDKINEPHYTLQLNTEVRV